MSPSTRYVAFFLLAVGACGRDSKPAPTSAAAPALTKEAERALADLEKALDGASGPTRDATRGTSQKRGTYHASTAFEVPDGPACDFVFDEVVSESLTDAEAKVRPTQTRITRKVALAALEAGSIGTDGATAVAAAGGPIEARCTTTVGEDEVGCAIGGKSKLLLRLGSAAKASEIAGKLRDAAAACRAGGAS